MWIITYIAPTGVALPVFNDDGTVKVFSNWNDANAYAVTNVIRPFYTWLLGLTQN